MNRRDDYPAHVKTLYAELESRHHRGEFILDYNRIQSTPEEALSTIKWINPVDSSIFKNGLDRMAEDILRGGDNSLASGDSPSW